ncbi:hypothetical protein D3C73_984190 [compost metagenome]
MIPAWKPGVSSPGVILISTSAASVLGFLTKLMVYTFMLPSWAVTLTSITFNPVVKGTAFRSSIQTPFTNTEVLAFASSTTAFSFAAETESSTVPL